MLYCSKNAKKLFCLIIFLCVISIFTSSLALAVRVSFEPEAPEAVSYNCMATEKPSLEVTFTKYVTKDGKCEYWMRLWNTKINRKIYPIIRFYIDDVMHELVAINNPDDKYIFSAQSLYDPSFVRYIPPRFFTIHESDMNKILNSENVYFDFDCVTSVNNRVHIEKDFLEKMREMFQLTYEDFYKYWTPVDRAK